MLTGGDFFSVSDIPTPFGEDLAFGEVIKEIRVEGNKDTRTSLIYAAMRSKVGEIYTEESAELDYKWITQLGVVTSIHFETIREADGIILVVQLTEVNKYVPAPVIRITDENGLSLGARFTSANVLGLAASASVYFIVGGTTNFGIRFKDPWIPGRSLFFGYYVSYEHAERRNEIYDFDERSDDFYFELTRNLTNSLRWGPQVMYLGVSSDSSDVTLSDSDTDEIPTLGAFLKYDGRNLPIYPTRGWWGGLNIKKYGLGNVETDYWQASLDLRKYFELGSVFNSLALYSLTTFSTGEVGVDFPIYMQFNLGGANSVRGWSLGSREGKNQFINTVEYWHALMDHKRWKFWFFKFAMGFQLGVFGDAGVAWSESSQFEQNWIGGGGVGLRLLVPASVMFRIDVAGGEEGAKIRFFVASREKAVAQLDRVR
jgi:outer membrane protein assembly factor BamA